MGENALLGRQVIIHTGIADVSSPSDPPHQVIDHDRAGENSFMGCSDSSTVKLGAPHTQPEENESSQI